MIREVQCYMIIDKAQETIEMPQKTMSMSIVDKEGKITDTKKKTVAEAYPQARRSVDKSQLVIPVEVGENETFEEVYAAMKTKFHKPIMAHKETIKALNNTKWKAKE